MSEAKPVKKVILGIDPGLRISGYAVIFEDYARRIALIEADYLALPPDETIAKRIALFHEFFTKKITEFHVTDIAIETPFLGKNAANFLKLGYLRGIVHLLVAHHTLHIHEFAPRSIKQSITGFGGAEKEQVSRVITKLFRTTAPTKKYDVTDAIAVALCASWNQNNKMV